MHWPAGNRFIDVQLRAFHTALSQFQLVVRYAAYTVWVIAALYLFLAQVAFFKLQRVNECK